MYALPFLDIPPLVSAAGTVRLPGSKSISNRVLLLAGLAEGETVVRDLLDSDDTRVMLDALRALGCGIDEQGDALRVRGIGLSSPALVENRISSGMAPRPVSHLGGILGG